MAYATPELNRAAVKRWKAQPENRTSLRDQRRRWRLRKQEERTMPLSREKVEKMVESAVDAINDEFEDAKKAKRKPSASVLAAAIKLAQQIQMSTGPALIPPPTPVSLGARQAEALADLAARGKLRRLPFLLDHEKETFAGEMIGEAPASKLFDAPAAPPAPPRVSDEEEF